MSWGAGTGSLGALLLLRPRGGSAGEAWTHSHSHPNSIPCACECGPSRQGWARPRPRPPQDCINQCTSCCNKQALGFQWLHTTRVKSPLFTLDIIQGSSAWLHVLIRDPVSFPCGSVSLGTANFLCRMLRVLPANRGRGEGREGTLSSTRRPGVAHVTSAPTPLARIQHLIPPRGRGWVEPSSCARGGDSTASRVCPMGARGPIKYQVRSAECNTPPAAVLAISPSG